MIFRLQFDELDIPRMSIVESCMLDMKEYPALFLTKQPEFKIEQHSNSKKHTWTIEFLYEDKPEFIMSLKEKCDYIAIVLKQYYKGKLNTEALKHAFDRIGISYNERN